LIVFGFALVASHSKRLAALLDRTEPKLHRLGHRVSRRWKGLPGRSKVGVITGIAAVGVVALLAMWKFVVAAYVLG
jgi:type II secretory pathway component PulM